MTKDKETPPPNQGTVPHAADKDSTPDTRGTEYVRDLIRGVVDRRLPVLPWNIDLFRTLLDRGEWNALADYLVDLEAHRPGCQTRQYPCYVCEVQKRQAGGS